METAAQGKFELGRVYPFKEVVRALGVPANCVGIAPQELSFVQGKLRQVDAHGFLDFIGTPVDDPRRLSHRERDCFFSLRKEKAESLIML